MTPEELAALTPEQKRIRIAKACGWTGIFKKLLMGYCGDRKGMKELPDYLNDLNACHEMEKVLLEPARSKRGSSNPSDHAQLLYDMKLMHAVAGLKENYSPFDYFLRSTATAAQRCDAFLLTI